MQAVVIPSVLELFLYTATDLEMVARCYRHIGANRARPRRYRNSASARIPFNCSRTDFTSGSAAVSSARIDPGSWPTVRGAAKSDRAQGW